MNIRNLSVAISIATVLMAAASPVRAQSDPEACKRWSKDFKQVSDEAKTTRAKLMKYMPKGKDLKNLDQWKANVDNATFNKIRPLVNSLDELNARGKRLFDLMHRGRCPA